MKNTSVPVWSELAASLDYRMSTHCTGACTTPFISQSQRLPPLSNHHLLFTASSCVIRASRWMETTASAASLFFPTDKKEFSISDWSLLLLLQQRFHWHSFCRLVFFYPASSIEACYLFFFAQDARLACLKITPRHPSDKQLESYFSEQYFSLFSVQVTCTHATRLIKKKRTIIYYFFSIIADDVLPRLRLAKKFQSIYHSEQLKILFLKNKRWLIFYQSNHCFFIRTINIPRLERMKKKK